MKSLIDVIKESMEAKSRLVAEAKEEDDEQDEDGDIPNKHILVQMHKVLTMGGKKQVEFKNGDKVEVHPDHAHKFLKKYIGTNRPMEKLKLSDKAAASHKDFLEAIK